MLVEQSSLTEEEIVAIASPVILYTKKAMEICDIYVSHCGRCIVQPNDIVRCMQCTVMDFEEILNTDVGKQELCHTYVEILKNIEDDLPFSLEDGSDSDSDRGNEDDSASDIEYDSESDEVSTELKKNTFKNCIETLFPILRNFGSMHNEAAAQALKLATRGFNADNKHEFCESLCPCLLCKKVNKRHLEWDQWTATTPNEKHIKKAIDKICTDIMNG